MENQCCDCRLSLSFHGSCPTIIYTRKFCQVGRAQMKLQLLWMPGYFPGDAGRCQDMRTCVSPSKRGHELFAGGSGGPGGFGGPPVRRTGCGWRRGRELCNCCAGEATGRHFLLSTWLQLQVHFFGLRLLPLLLLLLLLLHCRCPCRQLSKDNAPHRLCKSSCMHTGIAGLGNLHGKKMCHSTV